MVDVVLFFEVHQPYRLNRRWRDVLRRLEADKGSLNPQDLEKAYFDHGLNKIVMDRVASRCYLQANKAILDAIVDHAGREREFKVAYSLSGVFIEQAEKYAPKVIESFRSLAETGLVEFVEQTYFHSLASLVSDEEFREQLRLHNRKVRDLFGVSPASAENTEFIYNNRIAKILAEMGYRVTFTEGAEKILAGRSPNHVYSSVDGDIRVLLRNYRLSDDIGFRYAARWWEEYPLTPDKYAAWLSKVEGDVVFLAIDYETFGEHFPPETGIIEFLRKMPGEVLKWENLVFETPLAAAEKHEPIDSLDVPEYATVSWADLERDLTAWLMNEMQFRSFSHVRRLEKVVRELGDPGWTRLWRLLLISDHFYYMSTKGSGTGDVHSYFSPYGTALEAYTLYMSILNDFETRLIRAAGVS